MSKFKNFRIDRDVVKKEVFVSDLKIGDVFEREGSIHMRVNNYESPATGKLAVCNLNTGAVWTLSNDAPISVVLDCVIDYKVEK